MSPTVTEIAFNIREGMEGRVDSRSVTLETMIGMGDFMGVEENYF
jgi:hypothetical protein